MKTLYAPLTVFVTACACLAYGADSWSENDTLAMRLAVIEIPSNDLQRARIELTVGEYKMGEAYYTVKMECDLETPRGSERRASWSPRAGAWM